MARNRWENRNRLLRKLKMLPDAVRTEIGQAIREGADDIVVSQKRLAPKRSGELAESIVVTIGGQIPKYASLAEGQASSDPELTAVITAGNSEARHAHVVEFGTAPHENKGRFAGTEHPGTKAQPFFFPPYRSHKKRVRSKINRATKRAARQVAGSS